MVARFIGGACRAEMLLKRLPYCLIHGQVTQLHLIVETCVQGPQAPTVLTKPRRRTGTQSYCAISLVYEALVGQQSVSVTIQPTFLTALQPE